ncbi:MAG: hypothetical protein NTV52_37200, partial [Acidobacteria bacterium]|nr:hypothetical protein [Acidobacteriota bacterium]
MSLHLLNHLVASMPVGTLFTAFDFYMVQAVVDTTGMPNTGSGTGAVFSVFVDPVGNGPTYVDGTVICLVSGTGYAPGDVITVPGPALRGISPSNDMTITVATINLATGIESFTESGNINVTAYPVWFVEDGASDQYDWGNYLGTSATRCEFTASTDATSYLIVTDVAYGTLATGQSVYFEDNGQSSTILWQLSGTPGGVGTYICGGYNTPIPNQSSLTRYAVGIDYKVNAVDNVNAQFGVGSEYGSMYGDAIFAMVGTGASISAFYYAGETGSDGQGNKLVTSPLIATGSSLNLNVVDQNWKFSADGSLTFPDNTVQTTAYTGSAATGYTLTVGDINTSFTNFDVVTVDSAGNTYYLGHTTGLTPGNSPFIIKVDSSGSVSWQTTLLYDGVVTAAVTFETTMILTFSDGDTPSQTWIVYINTSTGQVTNSYYYVVTVETIKVRDLVLGLSGGVPAWESVVGYFNSGTGGENSALIYFSSIGPSWTYSIAEDGAVGAVEYYGTATNPASANVYAVGSSLTYGSVVTFYTPAGDLQWHKNIDLTQPLTITATSVAYSNGYIYVVSNNTDNGNDGFITKLDAITGAIIWQNGMGYGLTGDPFGIADGCVTIDGNGDIITAWNYGSVFSQGM